MKFQTWLENLVIKTKILSIIVFHEVWILGLCDGVQQAESIIFVRRQGGIKIKQGLMFLSFIHRTFLNSYWDLKGVMVLVGISKIRTDFLTNNFPKSKGWFESWKSFTGPFFIKKKAAVRTYLGRVNRAVLFEEKWENCRLLYSKIIHPSIRL